ADLARGLPELCPARPRGAFLHAGLSLALPFRVVTDRFRLALDEHLGRDQPLHPDHARRRTDGAERLTVRPADLLPVIDVDHVDPGPYHVFQARPDGADGRLD